LSAKLTVRTARPEDAAVCGQICYNAFSTINAQHNFPCDFPSAEVPIAILSHMFSNPAFYCVVAELDGRLIGSNCLDLRSTVAGIGPITIDPAVQNSGTGRKLMQAVMDRAAESRAAGIRLVQAAFHNRSLSLYTTLGFDTREPLSCMQGRTTTRSIPGCSVRPAVAADIPACNELSHRVHGFDRGTELADAIHQKTAVLVERDGRVTGYSSALAFFGHSTAETNTDLQALIASVDAFGGSGILVPTRNSALFRWCLANGLRVTQPMTLMSAGLYNDPAGAWMPSVLF
jgi:predicted N-acetyltransferase YhbS